MPLLFKKRISKTSSIYNLLQLSIDNDKPNTTNTSKKKAETATWFWNKSANKTDLNLKNEGSRDIDRKDLEKQSKIKQVVYFKAFQIELKLKKEEKKNLCDGYEKGSKRTQMRHNKSIWDLEIKVLKIYNIQTIWQ